MSVPFLDLSRQYASMRTDIESAVGSVLEGQRFILGPEVGRLEEALASKCGALHGVGVASGTDALILALQGMGIKEGDEVLTTPFSFFATASCIARVGARPVFADIDEATCTLDPEAVAREAGPRTRAILPVHIFGQCAPMRETARAVASALGRAVPLVEDAAQAIGASRMGRPAGSQGSAACFSFYPTKNLGGAGDGGMLVTDDADLAARVRRLRAHGDAGRYDHREVGINSRLDTIQAAILLVKLKRLDDWNEARRVRAATYDRLLADAGGDLRLPVTAAGNVHTFHQYVVRTSRRDALARHLREQGIGTAVYYPQPLHLQPCFASLGYRPGRFPRSEAACREVLALPIYPELTEGEQERVADAVRGFFRGD